MWVEREDLHRLIWVAITFAVVFGIAMFVSLPFIVIIVFYGIVALLMSLIAGVGLAFAPFAALVSRKMSRSRGLNPGTYFLAGAIYSATFLLPWLHMMAVAKGKRFPPSLVQLGYVILYLAWLFGPISTIGLYLIVIALIGEADEYINPRYFILAVACGLMSFAWIISLTNLIARERQDVAAGPFVGLYTGPSRTPSHRGYQTGSLLLERRHLMPLVYALVSVVGYVILFYVVGEYLHSLDFG